MLALMQRSAQPNCTRSLRNASRYNNSQRLRQAHAALSLVRETEPIAVNRVDLSACLDEHGGGIDMAVPAGVHQRRNCVVATGQLSGAFTSRPGKCCSSRRTSLRLPALAA